MKDKDNIGLIMLFISIILFISKFLILWYSDQLFDSNFLLSLVMGIFIIFLSIIFLIFAFISRKISKSKLILISIIITFITLILKYIFPFRVVRANLELYVFENERFEIIEKIKNNELEYDENNNIILPKNYKKYSSSGEVNVHKNDEEGQIIGFWVFRGLMLGDSIELIYSSKDKKFVEENVDYIRSIKQLKKNWFYVVIK